MVFNLGALKETVVGPSSSSSSRFPLSGYVHTTHDKSLDSGEAVVLRCVVLSMFIYMLCCDWLVVSRHTNSVCDLNTCSK